jgi:hypothetical protein
LPCLPLHAHKWRPPTTLQLHAQPWRCCSETTSIIRQYFRCVHDPNPASDTLFLPQSCKLLRLTLSSHRPPVLVRGDTRLEDLLHGVLIAQIKTRLLVSVGAVCAAKLLMLQMCPLQTV